MARCVVLLSFLPMQYGWGPDVYLRYSTNSKLLLSPPNTRVGVEPADAVVTYTQPPSPPMPPPLPSPK